MYDRRVNNWVFINAYLFDTHFADGLTTEIEVNPEFGSPAAALIEAQKYGAIIGQLPRSLRIDVDAVWIHKGTQPFGGGNRSLLIHTGQADLYAADGILEETFVHEASHTSLDASHASSPGWLAAQSADDNFISSYALDNPTREDVAESFLPYLAVRHRLNRISQSLANTILQTIPNRINYFDNQDFDISPQSVDNAIVVGRHLFYNQSGTSTRYDGNNPAINASDDAAIATDKTAYLWENPGAATFANVSGYTKGINGIMVDISGSHPNISADDFIFRVGNNNTPGNWSTANAPTSISVRAGAGIGGSDRVTIIWNGIAAPIKRWLNVVVLANAETGLAQKVGYPVGWGDAFFFGSAPGNTGAGDTVLNSQVTAHDEAGIRANPALVGANVPISNIYDVNRSASVSAIDESAARLNGTNAATTLKYLNLATAPAAPEADGEVELSPQVASDSGVASALTAPAARILTDGVHKWLSNRIEVIDLNSRTSARLFLHDANTRRSRASLQKFDAVVDALDLDDELLDMLLADLG